MIESTRSSIATRLGTTEADELSIAVQPIEALHALRYLFAALELVFDVRFTASTNGAWRHGALLSFEGISECRQDMLPAARTMVFQPPPEAIAAPGGRVRFSVHPAVDPRLRGQTLQEKVAVLAPCPTTERDAVLATSDGGPVWIRSPNGVVDRTSMLPEELLEGETLRDHLRPGRCAALLPLFAFLRDLKNNRAWTRPTLRAAFIVDDPNLHWPSYGYVRYPELARSAENHHYHAVMAMVPLDGWFAHRGAAEHFCGPEARLSITVHGDSHLSREFEAVQTFQAGGRLAAQALRRAASFERRTGLEIDRVMVPPHGGCSEAALQGLRAAGFEAACIERPYPWVARRGDSAFKHPSPWRPLTAMASAEVVEGCPMLLRQTFDAGEDDLVLRAYLDQPLLVYGHHDDLAAGLGVMEEAARRINRLGTVEWLRLRNISRSSFDQRRCGPRLCVRAFARRLTIPIPEGVSELELVVPWQELFAARLCAHAVTKDGRSTVASVRGSKALLALDPECGASVLDVSLTPLRELDIPNTAWPRPNPWHVMRRVAVEARDRAMPLLGRSRS